MWVYHGQNNYALRNLFIDSLEIFQRQSSSGNGFTLIFYYF